MNIIETDIPDITTENIDESKVDFADKVITNVFPLFDQVINEKKTALQETQAQQIQAKKTIHDNRLMIKKLMESHKKKQKIKKLLSMTEKLLHSGLLNEGHLKQETIIMLKIVDKLPDDKLNEQIRRTSNLISKRFG